MIVSETFPNPPILSEMEPFFDGLEKGRFLLLKCRDCGRRYWPFAACSEHRTEPYFGNMEWTPATGLGRLFTYTIPQWSFHPSFRSPYVFGVVELDEGPMMPSNIVHIEPSEVRIGMRLRVTLQRAGNGRMLPYFEPFAETSQ